MAAASDYLENNIIDHFLRNQAFTPPAAIYLALFEADTGLESNNPSAEQNGGAYARQACALDAASGGATANTSDISFPAATGADWDSTTHCDSIGNTVLFHEQVSRGCCYLAS